MTACAHCLATTSPADANFCVACGYALRQPCPYADCDYRQLAVQAGPPQECCPACQRFLLFCPHCYRLHRLDEKLCRTKRCQSVGARPREWYFACDCSRGQNASGSAPLPFGWKTGQAARLNGEISWATPTSTEAIHGLAFRFGHLVLSTHSHALSYPLPREQHALTAPIANQFTRLESEPSNGLGWATPHALFLAHGYGYSIGPRHAQRFDLRRNAPTSTPPGALLLEMESWHEGGNAATINWQFQTATSSRWWALGQTPTHDWVAVSSSSLAATFEAKAEALPVFDGTPLDWLTFEDAPLLVTATQLFHWQNGEWLALLPTHGLPAFKGVFVWREQLVVWGEDSQDVWVCVLTRGDQSEWKAGPHQPVRVEAGSLHHRYAHPVLIHDWLVFAAETRQGARPLLAIFDLLSPLEARPALPLRANARLAWMLGATHQPQGWLAFALDDGRDVEFYAVGLQPARTKAWLISKTRPLREAHGAYLAATLAQGRLAIEVLTERGGKLGVWQLDEAIPHPAI